MTDPVCSTCGKGKEFTFCSNAFHVLPAEQPTAATNRVEALIAEGQRQAVLLEGAGCGDSAEIIDRLIAALRVEHARCHLMNRDADMWAKRAEAAEKEREDRIDLDVAKRMVMATAKVEAMREALRIYGGHVQPCKGDPCRCGFKEAWDRWVAP